MSDCERNTVHQQEKEGNKTQLRTAALTLTPTVYLMKPRCHQTTSGLNKPTKYESNAAAVPPMTTGVCIIGGRGLGEVWSQL